MKTHREMLDYMKDVERTQSEWCKEVWSEVKELVGTNKMIVFDRPISTYGNYGEFTQMAMCGGKILMSNNANGWCDKPVQPYHGMFWHFMRIKARLEKGEYHLEDSPIRDSEFYVTC